MNPQAAIGLFDSGFGGLTVLKELIALLPHENFIYLADSARAPIGDKPAGQILSFAQENSEYLLSKKVKLIVVACHTAGCHAQEILKNLPIPSVNIVDAALSMANGYKSLAVLATLGTIDSGLYQNRLQKESGVRIDPKACPLFVPLIEKGMQDSESALMAAHQYLNAIEADAALLACTHYPLMQGSIEKVLKNTKILNPAKRCAEEVERVLKQKRLLNPQKAKGNRQFYVSGDPACFQKLAALFLGECIERVEKK